MAGLDEWIGGGFDGGGEDSKRVALDELVESWEV